MFFFLLDAIPALFIPDWILIRPERGWMKWNANLSIHVYSIEHAFLFFIYMSLQLTCARKGEGEKIIEI
jgi:hypothetical protein